MTDSTRSAAEREFHETARLHVTELPHGLFPHLGVGFVRRWHSIHGRSPFGVTLVCVHGDEVIGFLLGTTDQSRHVAWIIEHHGRGLTLAGIRAMLVRPRVAAHFVRTRAGRYLRRLTRRRPAPAGPQHPAEAGVAVLDAVVVHPDARGRGVGRMMVDTFLATVAAQGAERVELVTKSGPEGAAGFYRRAGWAQVGEHVDRDGELALTFRIDPSRRPLAAPTAMSQRAS